MCKVLQSIIAAGSLLNLLCLQLVPTERLLVYQISQGWRPLCAFLGKLVPQEPFPHANDRQHWKQLVSRIRRFHRALTYGVPAAAAATVGTLAAVILKCGNLRH